MVYPKALSGRLEMSTQLRENVEVNSARLYGGEDRVISLDDVKQLVVLCVRLESLSAGKVFGDSQPIVEASPAPNGTVVVRQQAARWHAAYTFGPTVSAEMTDDELIAIIESLTTRIENAMSTLVSGVCTPGSVESRLISLVTSTLNKLAILQVCSLHCSR